MKGQYLVIQRKKTFLEQLVNRDDTDLQAKVEKNRELEVIWQSNLHEIDRMNGQINASLNQLSSGTVTFCLITDRWT